ncbi:calmodulin [Trichonephila clavipes]|nr:calmodulin [Trichonephila clavipes]
MLPPLARKPMILPFGTSDKSIRFCITPTIEMFSEALTHPLYTLNCTVLPPAFCDWLFNSEVETEDNAVLAVTGKCQKTDNIGVLISKPGACYRRISDTESPKLQGLQLQSANKDFISFGDF